MIAKNHALFAQYYRVATPDWDTIQWAYDKRLTYQRAAELGIDFPKSFQPLSLEATAQIECRFPVILKPAFRKGVNEFTQAKAWKAEDREHLLSLYKRAAALVGNDAIIVQESIPGGGEAQFSFAALCERGEPIVSLTARRARQHPIDFGRSSTFRRKYRTARTSKNWPAASSSRSTTPAWSKSNSNKTRRGRAIQSCSTSMAGSGPGTGLGAVRQHKLALSRLAAGARL